MIRRIFLGIFLTFILISTLPAAYASNSVDRSMIDNSGYTGYSKTGGPRSGYLRATFSGDFEWFFHFDDERTYSMRLGTAKLDKKWDADQFLVTRDTSTFEILKEDLIEEDRPIEHWMADWPFYAYGEHMLVEKEGGREIASINLTTMEEEWAFSLADDEHGRGITTWPKITEGLEFNNNSPAVIIETSGGGRGNNSIIALDLDTGSMLWNKDLTSIEQIFNLRTKNGRMAIERVLIEETPENYGIQVISLDNGSDLWSMSVQDLWANWPGFNDIDDWRQSFYFQLGDVKIFDDILYIHSNSNVTGYRGLHQISAYDLDTGKPLWSDYIENDTSGFIVGEEYVAVFTNKTLQAYDRMTGTLAWKYELGFQWLIFGHIYYDAEYGFHHQALMSNDTIYFIDLEDYEQPCKRYPEHVTCKDVGEPGVMILKAVDLTTGKEIWRYNFLDYYKPHIKGIYNEELYVDAGVFFVFSDDTEKGLDLSFPFSNQDRIENFIFDIWKGTNPPSEFPYSRNIDYDPEKGVFNVRMFDNGYDIERFSATIEIYDKPPEEGGWLLASERFTLEPGGGHILSIPKNPLLPQFEEKNRYYVRIVDISPKDIQKQNNDMRSWVKIEQIDYTPFLITTTLIILGSFTAAYSTEVGKYRMLLGLGVPLYTRLKKKEILDNRIRYMIYGIIISRPGIHLNQVRRLTKKSNFLISYHLEVLEKEGFIHSKRWRTKKLFYPEGKHIGQDDGHRNPMGALSKTRSASCVIIDGGT